MGSANPPVTSYQLLKNDVVVDTSSSGMWIRMLPNIRVIAYKCLANNTVGTANSTSVIITFGGKYGCRHDIIIKGQDNNIKILH